MQRTGPDSLRSWVIVFYCSLISMMLYGVVRLSGIMFVASMERFQVDRQSASLPYILCDSLQAMAGPITGFLSLKFGARQVMMLGSFIAAVGTGACFFAENIETVTALWGVVYGLGFGLSSLLLPAIIIQHFVKRRASAISLVYFGAYVGFSFLPSIADLLIHTYGLSGTYLFLSGFLLHCVPLSMLLRKPDHSQAQKIQELRRSSAGTQRSRAASISIVGGYPLCVVKEPRCSIIEESFDDPGIIPSENENFQNESDRKDSVTTITNSISLYNTRQIESRKQSLSHFGRDNEGFSIEDLPKLDHQFTTDIFKQEKKSECIEDQTYYSKTNPKLLHFQRIESSSNIFTNPTSKEYYTDISYNEEIEKRDKFPDEIFTVFPKPARISRSVSDRSFYDHSIKTDNISISTNQDHSQIHRAASILKQEITISKGMTIFFEPMFLLVLFGNAVYASSFIAFITVIVDFSIDIGMSESDGKYIIMFFSIASNVGLLSFGWVTDGGYLSLTSFAALMLLIRTVTLCVIPYSSGYIMLMTVVILQGFFEASLANIFPLLVTEYFIDEVHELAISCTLFLCGPMYLGTPVLIGFFRDGLGSYLYLFLLMATLSLICSILHFIAPLLAKCRCGRDDWILRKRES
ncbi:monocarboxylate transporter 12-B-like isoform X3 [Argiope bruennichi]|uniref:Monocarboxylate transporter 9 like protein n=1 Tax=Argiope bruennichi TaxID=94029 RepID=A0A8T0EFS2_ARGBR|nr:monocarboxylate transporter 12-B-like isoform X3 [Argiope bruennichi]KAF8770805.1 Monocarboxylate transporter 9 like protein [Argiope bruennichi]